MFFKEFDLITKNQKSLYYTLVISILYIVPFLVANFTYLDDYGRDLHGYGWQHDGRFISTLLGKIWSLNNTIVSIFPFSLILSALVLGFSGFLLVVLLDIEKGKRLKWSSLLLLTSPFYLGNLVFKFDCLPMALSVLCIVLPFLFYENRIKFTIFSILGVFLSFGIYQATATAFIIIGIIFIIRNILNNNYKTILKDVLNIGFVFIISYLMYDLVLRLFNLTTSGRDEIILFNPDFLLNLDNNNVIYFERLDGLLRTGNYKYFILFFILFTLLGTISNIYKNNISFIIFKFSSVALAIVTCFYLIPSVNMLLKESYWDYRSFSGLGFILVFGMLLQNYLPNKIKAIGRVSCVILVLFSFILVAQFGRLLNNQTEYQRYFITELHTLIKNNPVKKIAFIGFLPYAPKNEFSYANFPIFENILGRAVSQFSAWNKPILNEYGRFSKIEFVTGEEFKCKGEMVEKAYYYDAKLVDSETLVIDFNRDSCE